MASVSGVLKRYASGYIQMFGAQMNAQQRKTLRAVEACRESSLGTIDYVCAGCGQRQTVPRSCCNRHCAACQWQRQRAWLADQQRRLLPCAYFMITFTLPSQLRPLAIHRGAIVYRALLQASAGAIKAGAKNPRFVGAVETGFTGVLHTWGRDLSYHPHAHFLVPAGGIDAAGRWQPSRASVFVAEQVLERLFRERLKALLGKAGLVDHVDASVWRGRFVVDSQAIGTGEEALKYLAPYVSRGPVADWRVSECNDADSLGKATLSLQVKRTGTRQYRPMSLSVIEFMRRWLMHVLPSGLNRVRHYGFFSGSSRRELEEVKLLVAAALGQLHYLACTQILVHPQRSAMQCPHCGGPMQSLGYSPPPTLRPRAPP